MNPTQTSFANDAKVFFMRVSLFMLFLLTLTGIGIQHAYADDSALLSQETLLNFFQPNAVPRKNFAELQPSEQSLVIQFANEGKKKGLSEADMRKLAGKLIRYYRDSSIAEQILAGKRNMELLLNPIGDTGATIDELIGGQFAARGKEIDARYQALDSYKQARDERDKQNKLALERIDAKYQQEIAELNKRAAADPKAFERSAVELERSAVETAVNKNLNCKNLEISRQQFERLINLSKSIILLNTLNSALSTGIQEKNKIAKNTEDNEKENLVRTQEMKFYSNFNKLSMRERVRLAQKGEVLAQNFLGECYGQHKYYPESFYWTYKAAEQGHTTALYNLSIKYAYGKGVAQDIDEANRWLRKAAEAGYSDAQFSLGRKYANGDGVEKDTNEALKWLRKAAEDGNQEAKDLLATMQK